MPFFRGKKPRPAPIPAPAATMPAPQGNYAISAPGDNPDVSSFEPWSISLNGSFTPDSNAPMLSLATEYGVASDDIMVHGHQFTDATQVHVYGQSSSGATAVLVCTKKDRTGNVGVWQLPATLPSRAFCLLWPYDPTYGYGYPIVLNAPWVKTVVSEDTGGPSGAVGTVVHVAGFGLCDGKATPDARIYLRPTGGGSGTWVTPTSITDYELIFTIPSLANGTYELWVHNKKGGVYGWHRAYLDLTVNTLLALGMDWTGPSAVTVNMKTYTDIHGGGPGSGVSVHTAWAAAIAPMNGVGGTINLEAGTYETSSAITCVAGFGKRVRIIGQGKDVTILKPMTGYSHDTNYGVFQSSSSYPDIRNMTFDFDNAIGSAPGRIVQARSMTNVKVLSKARSSSVAAYVDIAIGCDFSGGANTGTLVSVNNSYSNFLFLNCTFALANFCDECVNSFFFSVNGLFKGCTAANYGNGSGGSNDYGMGRFFVSAYFARGVSFIECTTNGMTVNPSGDQNRGEQILFETTGVLYYFDPSGGTDTTVSVSAASLISMPTLRTGSSLSSINATSGTPTVSGTSIPVATQQGSGWYLQIVSGTNSIPGVYPLGHSGGNLQVTGAIGTAASISGITWNLLRDHANYAGSDFASSDATGSTPTFTTAQSVVSGDFLYITGGTNAIVGLYQITITGGVKKLDRACGSAASLSGVTFKTFPRLGLNHSSRKWIYVIGGKGFGQSAVIKTTTLSGGDMVYTLDRTWRIPVDSTSRIYVSEGFGDVHIDNCNLGGDGVNAGASCAFEAFGTALGIHMRNSTISGLRQGFVVWGGDPNLWGNSLNSVQFGMVISGCTFSNCDRSARLWQSASSLEYKQEQQVVTLLRNITQTTITDKFLNIQTYAGTYIAVQNLTASGAANTGIHGPPTAGRLLLHNCSITTTTAVGSTAITGSLTITADPSPASSQFVGFAS